MAAVAIPVWLWWFFVVFVPYLTYQLRYFWSPSSPLLSHLLPWVRLVGGGDTTQKNTKKDLCWAPPPTWEGPGCWKSYCLRGLCLWCDGFRWCFLLVAWCWINIFNSRSVILFRDVMAGWDGPPRSDTLETRMTTLIVISIQKPFRTVFYHIRSSKYVRIITRQRWRQGCLGPFTFIGSRCLSFCAMLVLYWI